MPLQKGDEVCRVLRPDTSRLIIPRIIRTVHPGTHLAVLSSLSALTLFYCSWSLCCTPFPLLVARLFGTVYHEHICQHCSFVRILFPVLIWFVEVVFGLQTEPMTRAG